MLLDVPSNIHGNRFTITANSGDCNRNGVDVILVVDPVAETVKVYNYERHLEKANALMLEFARIAFINENFGGVYIEGHVLRGKYNEHTWLKLVSVEE